jgi:hypothetical protein
MKKKQLKKKSIFLRSSNRDDIYQKTYRDTKRYSNNNKQMDIC